MSEGLEDSPLMVRPWGLQSEREAAKRKAKKKRGKAVVVSTV
jgi:hypothetical protein